LESSVVLLKLSIGSLKKANASLTGIAQIHLALPLPTFMMTGLLSMVLSTALQNPARRTNPLMPRFTAASPWQRR
jgi:hypothetical protein